jgi:hypothetical protein
LSRHGRIMTYLFIPPFLARCALIGARRCSSANLKRRAAFTSLADSDPGHREARAGRVRQHDKLLRLRPGRRRQGLVARSPSGLDASAAAAGGGDCRWGWAPPVTGTGLAPPPGGRARGSWGPALGSESGGPGLGRVLTRRRSIFLSNPIPTRTRESHVIIGQGPGPRSHHHVTRCTCQAATVTGDSEAVGACLTGTVGRDAGGGPPPRSGRVAAMIIWVPVCHSHLEPLRL